MRRALRTGLGALLIVSLAWSAVSAARLFESGGARVWVDQEVDRIAAEVDRQIARHANTEVVAVRVRSHLDADPRNWLALDALLDEARRAGIALPTDLAAEVDAARSADFGWMARTGKCLGCTWNPERCSFELVMLCRAPVEMTPIGDLDGLIREGLKYARGEDVDEVVLVLSGVGLTATGLVVMTGGSSVTVKAGAGLGKLARSMGAMPGWIARSLSDATQRGFDWSGLTRVRGTDDLAGLARPTVLRPSVTTLENSGRVVTASGAASGLYLIGKTANATELARLARVSEAMGARTVGVAEALGKSRLLRATLRLSDEVIQLAIGLVSALAALIGLVLSGAASATLRGARRALR